MSYKPHAFGCFCPTGCGKLFEGTPQQMWTSLSALAALPDETRVYCGHEYPLSNIKFALSIEPDNAALKKRAAEAQKQRAENKLTIPSLLRDEKEANVFLRADVPAVSASLGMSSKTPAEVFGEIRERKNKF